MSISRDPTSFGASLGFLTVLAGCYASGTGLGLTTQEDGGSVDADAGPSDAEAPLDAGGIPPTDGGGTDQGGEDMDPNALVPVVGHEDCWEGGNPQFKDVPSFRTAPGPGGSTSYQWLVGVPVAFGCLTYRASVFFVLSGTEHTPTGYALRDAGYSLEACSRCPGPMNLVGPDYGFARDDSIGRVYGTVSSLSFGIINDSGVLLSLSCFKDLECTSSGFDGRPAPLAPLWGRRERWRLKERELVSMFPWWYMSKAIAHAESLNPSDSHSPLTVTDYYVRDRHRGSRFSRLRVVLDVPSERAPLRSEAFVSRCQQQGFEMHSTCVGEAGSEDALERIEVELPDPPPLLLQTLEAAWAEL